MNKYGIISISQLFSMLFVSRMVSVITHSNFLTQSLNMWDHTISAVVSFLLTFLIIIPIYMIFKNDKKTDILEKFCNKSKKLGIVVPIFYGVYFVFVSVLTLSSFCSFVSNAINSPIPVFFLAITVILSACYGASKGVEGLARTASLILFFIVFLMILIGISLTAVIEKDNYPPLFYDGFSPLVNGILFMISGASCIPALVLLIPHSKGNLRIGFLIWNTAVYFLMGILIILVVGVLGNYQITQIFPIYKATTIAKVGSLGHVDAFYLSIWIMGVYIKMSLFMMLAGKSLGKIHKKVSEKSLIVPIGLLILILSFISWNSYDSSWIFGTKILLIFMLIPSFVIPLIFLLVKKIKNRGEIKVEN